VDEEQLMTWLNASAYAPDHPEEYRIRKLRITVQLEMEEEDEHISEAD